MSSFDEFELSDSPQQSPPTQTYRDYSAIPDEALGTTAERVAIMSRDQPSFPTKLYMMLKQLEEEDEDCVVGWEVHGRCFKIYDQQQFEEVILPRFFKQKKYSSFQRQLNLYDFKRITVGRDRGAYYHSMFLKGRPGLASRIKRIKFKGTGPRKPARPEMEPNFYQMPPVGTDETTHNLEGDWNQEANRPSAMDPLFMLHSDQMPSLAPIPDFEPSCKTSPPPSPTSVAGIPGKDLSSFLDDLLRQSEQFAAQHSNGYTEPANYTTSQETYYDV